VFRPKANVAGFVLALMIEPKRLETCLRRFLVKPTAWENAPRTAAWPLLAPDWE
jgi:hypothetical protein